MQGQLIENVKILSAAVPLDITGAGFNGDWANFHHFRKMAIVLQCGAWAGGTAAVTMEQATDNAGTSGKALAFATKWETVALTDDVPLEVTVTSDTFDLDTADELHVIEIDSGDLDVENAFTHVRVVVGTPGANADLLGCIYLAYHHGLAGNAATMPSIID